MAKLTFILQDGQVIDVPLNGEISIGRNEDNSVVVDAPQIAEKHAVVKIHDSGEAEVYDLNSTEGTFVNEVKVEHLRLVDGDRLRFGILEAVFDAEILQQTAATLLTEEDLGLRSSSMAINGGEQRSEAGVNNLVSRVFNEAGELSTSGAKVGENLRVQLSELEERKQVVCDELQVLETRRDTMFGQLRHAHARLEELRSAAIQAEKNRVADEKRVEDLRSEISEAEQKREAALKGKVEAEEIFEAAQQRMIQVRNGVGELETELEKLNSAMVALREEQSQRTAEVERLTQEETRLLDFCEKLAGTEQQLQEKSKLLSQLTTEHEKSYQSYAELQDNVAKLTADCADLEQRRNSVISHLEALQLQQQLADHEMAALISVLDETRGQRDELSTLVLRKRQEFDAMQSQLAHMQASRDQLQARLDEMGIVEERLIQAQEELRAVLNTKTGVLETLSQLAVQRDEGERDLARVTMALEKVEADHQNESLKFQGLQEQVAREQEHLADLQNQVKGHSDELLQLELDKKTVTGELEQLRSQSNTLSEQVRELEVRHNELTQLCEELSNTEAKLAEVSAHVESQSAERDRLEDELVKMTLKKEDLNTLLQALREKEESVQQHLSELGKEESALNSSLKDLREQEKMDRARFEEIRTLIREAEVEKNQQVERLERDLLMKQREMMEIEEKFAPLLAWKSVLDQRLIQFQELPEMSDEARALYEQLREDQHRMGSGAVFNLLNGNGPNSYQHGPVLRSHARQLEAKIRRDEDRLGILRSRVEQLEAEEQERSEKLAALENRLASLRKQMKQIDGIDPDLMDESSEVLPQATSRSVLGSIIEGSRPTLKPMQPRPGASTKG